MNALNKLNEYLCAVRINKQQFFVVCVIGFISVMIISALINMLVLFLVGE
jgi:hypothetical protein